MFPTLFDDSIFFRRPFLERQGYSAQEKDGKLVLKVNVLGLGKEDIKVRVEPVDNPNHMLLIIEGEKTDELSNNFKVNNRFYLHKQPKQVDPTVENGILTLVVEFKEPVIPDVKINWQ